MYQYDPLEFSEYGRNPRWPLLLTVFLAAVVGAGMWAVICEASLFLV
jgi:uncharacterized integral membrane protein